MTTRVLPILAGLLSVMGAAAQAHHSTVAYTPTTITLSNATMKRLTWANPHTVLSFDVKDARGKIVTWNAESGSPSALTRVGWHRNSLKSGDIVKVELFPARNGAPVGRLARVIFPDGRELLDSVFKASPFDTIQKK